MQDVFDYIESDCESNGTDTSDDGQMFSTNQTMMDAKDISGLASYEGMWRLATTKDVNVIPTRTGEEMVADAAILRDNLTGDFEYDHSRMLSRAQVLCGAKFALENFTMSEYIDTALMCRAIHHPDTECGDVRVDGCCRFMGYDHFLNNKMYVDIGTKKKYYFRDVCIRCLNDSDGKASKETILRTFDRLLGSHLQFVHGDVGNPYRYGRFDLDDNDCAAFDAAATTWKEGEPAAVFISSN